jgi:hypothetical protein
MDTDKLSTLTPQERKALEKLEAQLAHLTARKQAIVTKHSQRSRKEDTRRKIVVGGLVLALAADQKNEKTRTWLNDRLKLGVKEHERFLFPELWPEAKKPQRIKKNKTGTDETTETDEGKRAVGAHA